MLTSAPAAGGFELVDRYMRRGKVHVEVAALLDRAISDE
jgi:hypothetical protein